MAQVVYFAQRHADGLIKIGTSYNVDSRMCALHRGKRERVALLVKLPGGHGLEGRFHHHFRHEHVTGEWFQPSAHLLGTIAEIRFGLFDISDLPPRASPMRSEVSRRAWLKRRTRAAA